MKAQDSPFYQWIVNAHFEQFHVSVPEVVGAAAIIIVIATLASLAAQHSRVDYRTYRAEEEEVSLLRRFLGRK